MSEGSADVIIPLEEFGQRTRFLQSEQSREEKANTAAQQQSVRMHEMAGNMGKNRLEICVTKEGVSLLFVA